VDNNGRTARPVNGATTAPNIASLRGWHSQLGVVGCRPEGGTNDLGVGRLTSRRQGHPAGAAYASLLERHGFERIETGQLVGTYARSRFDDTRRKEHKYGARGTTLEPWKRRHLPGQRGLTRLVLACVVGAPRRAAPFVTAA
jgi:hypothetical protein